MTKYFLLCGAEGSDPYILDSNGAVQKKIEELLSEYGPMTEFTVIKGEQLTIYIRPAFHVSVGGQ